MVYLLNVDFGETKEEKFTGPQKQEGTSANIKIDFYGGYLNVALNGETIYNNPDIAMHESGKMGIRIWGYARKDSWTYIGQDGSGDEFGSNWYMRNSKGAYRRFEPDSEVNKTDYATIFAKHVQPCKAKVRAVGNVVTIFWQCGLMN